MKRKERKKKHFARQRASVYSLPGVMHYATSHLCVLYAGHVYVFTICPSVNRCHKVPLAAAPRQISAYLTFPGDSLTL